MPPAKKKTEVPAVETVKLPDEPLEDTPVGVDTGLDNEAAVDPSDVDEAAGEDPSDTDTATDTAGDSGPDDSTTEQATDPVVDPDLVWVAEPCAKCFPNGWPSTEQGAHVNCPHDHPIAFGSGVMITRERALELGFVEKTPE